ncbi:MAG: LytTR family DNA-binding domain-containing protein [Bacteroidales bacterium]|nr:LytTR family DNA-binding domain-containing protein [Bacteroidales bacterium]MDD4602500.1 LytTR family DNA-binding domain-containing protein [Bacteroidales bacterium]
MREKKINCLIVDDEPMALVLLQSYVVKTPFLELKGKCSNAIEALEKLNEERIDLLFLDIQMPELNGLELSRTLSKNTRVIFTTAFNQYALDGYKVEALDYLLKPFDYTEFLTAANKAKEWFSLLRVKSDTEQDTQKFLFVKTEYKQVKIDLDEVLYVEGLKDYIKIWLVGKPYPVLTLMTLKSIEEELPEHKFMRVHRSFIIALNKIQSIERGQVIINSHRITVAEQYKEKFQNFVTNNSVD